LGATQALTFVSAVIWERVRLTLAYPLEFVAALAAPSVPDPVITT
jgi:hypothetical protein